MWIDYKKAFDFVLYLWILEKLRLVKVLVSIVTAISDLTSSWTTVLKLNTKNDYIITDRIQYCESIFQGGDILFVILFILSVSPLLFILRKS